MTALIVVVFLTLFISASCSLFEATLYSSRSGALEAARTEGTRKALATRLLEMKADIAVPIASILILNTVAHTAGATVAGMYATQEMGSSWLPLFSVVLTLAILFLSEIAPKTLGAVYWRNLWPHIVRPLAAMEWALYPAIVLTGKFSNLLTRGKEPPSTTEDEILAVVRMGAKEGEITKRESSLVHNIIGLENKPIREIMTPRTVMVSLNADMSIREAVKAVDEVGLTRFPIYEGDRENIIGYIMIHDLYSSKIMSQPETLVKSIAKPISFVPQSTDSLTHLTKSISRRRHISIVVDEYGGVAGLITLEDLLETMLGDEIVDETDLEVDLQVKARRRRRQLVENMDGSQPKPSNDDE
jgi:magnesium and cobalt exporter, CNNM family